MNAMTRVPDATTSENAPKVEAYDVRELIRNGVQTCLMLDDQAYYLRITRAGKLILTK